MYGTLIFPARRRREDNGRNRKEPEGSAGRLGRMRIGLILTVAAILAACLGPDAPVSGTGGAGGPTPTGRLQIEAVAGPVCPVERQPPDPACAPRPVKGAVVVVSPADGRDILIGRGVTDGQGTVALDVPAGAYRVSGVDVAGLMGRPADVHAVVVAGAVTPVTLVYDTGIR